MMHMTPQRVKTQFFSRFFQAIRIEIKKRKIEYVITDS